MAFTLYILSPMQPSSLTFVIFHSYAGLRATIQTPPAKLPNLAVLPSP